MIRRCLSSWCQPSLSPFQPPFRMQITAGGKISVHGDLYACLSVSLSVDCLSSGCWVGTVKCCCRQDARRRPQRPRINPDAVMAEGKPPSSVLENCKTPTPASGRLTGCDTSSFVGGHIVAGLSPRPEVLHVRPINCLYSASTALVPSELLRFPRVVAACRYIYP